MNESIFPWKRIVFKRIVPGDIRKLKAESNDAQTGGGARDFRFSPSNQFWPVFSRMFPATDEQGRLSASFSWENRTTTTTLIHPPTNARPTECRIATVNECCPLGCLPPEDEETLFLLAQEENVVNAFFITIGSLTKSRWSNRIKRFLKHLLELQKTGNSTPAGYVDFETNEQFSNTTTLTMNNLSWNEYPPFEPFANQSIFYGAPGTGKSHRTNEIVATFADTIRTTFHPDSDYASFVGCYKPTMKPKKRIALVGKKFEEGDVSSLDESLQKEEVIFYSFMPQAFTDAYVQAWTKIAKTPADGKPDAQFLIIEEINRGNCAQVFGDLFQLLDRHDNGFSQYPINADADLKAHLEKRLSSAAAAPETVAQIDTMLAEAKTKATWEDVRKGKKLILPPNLFIWATMNTSDQSLFPMDSAFKRRWDWKYVPITKNTEEDYKIEIDGTIYDWWIFVKAINEKIFGATYSEDKKLGYFFVKAVKKDGMNIIDADRFLNKVVFYLWNDVFKNSEPEKAFKFDRPDKKENIATFQDFFNEETGERNDAMLKAFLAGLKVKPEEPVSNESTMAASSATDAAEGASTLAATESSTVPAPAPEVASVPDATEADGASTANV